MVKTQKNYSKISHKYQQDVRKRKKQRENLTRQIFY